MTDERMHIVHDTVPSYYLVKRSQDVMVEERGQTNYHCALCGTLLIRHASERLSDIVVMCQICGSLNEPPQPQPRTVGWFTD